MQDSGPLGLRLRTTDLSDSAIIDGTTQAGMRASEMHMVAVLLGVNGVLMRDDGGECPDSRGTCPNNYSTFYIHMVSRRAFHSTKHHSYKPITKTQRQ